MQRNVRKSGLLCMLLSIAMLVGLFPAVTVSADPSGNWYDNDYAAAAAGFAGGNGSETTPYEISNAAQLALLAKNINKEITQYSGVYFKLTDDIDLGSHYWLPIGGNKDWSDHFIEFRGIFDGNNKKISNLYVNTCFGNVTELGGAGGLNAMYGLFGHVRDATIKNLGIESGNIKGVFDVGAIVGFGRNFKLENCYNKANVLDGGNKIGGLVGTVVGDNTEITNCYNAGNVSGVQYISGIVGFTNENVKLIKNCYNAGSITASNQNAGGIFGHGNNINSTKITGCFNMGNITSKAVAGVIIGGGNNLTGYTACGYSDAMTLTIDGVNSLAANTNGAEAKTGAEITTQGMYEAAGWIFSDDDIGWGWNPSWQYPVLTGKVPQGGDPEVTGVTISPSAVSVMKGLQKTFTATVIGSNLTAENKAVTWTVTGGVSGTSITSGVLTVAADETAATLTVTATSVFDTNISGTAIVTVLSSPWQGKGIAGNPFIIASAADLQTLAAMINDVSTNAFYAGSHYILANDIDLTGISWTPIGSDNDTACFRGVFDGNGYVINNIYINGTARNQGLFGYVKNASIKRLGINGSIKGGDNVGSIAANGDKVIIEECYSTVNVSGWDGNGGIIARVSDKTSQIINCYNVGNISGNGNVGGIAGTGSNGVQITNCYNAGNISNNNNSGAAGIVGKGEGGDGRAKITNCFNMGNVTSNNAETKIVAGNTGPRVGGYWGSNMSGCGYLEDMILTISGSVINIAEDDNDTTNYTNGAAAYTAAQLKTASSYNGWSFTDNGGPWQITGGYPTLAAFYHAGFTLNYDNGIATITTSEDIEGLKLIVAAYDINGRLLDTFFKTLDADEKSIETTGFDHTDSRISYIKAMLWIWDGIIPVTKAYDSRN